MIRTKGQRYAMIDAARQFVQKPNLLDRRSNLNSAQQQKRRKTLGGAKSFHMQNRLKSGPASKSRYSEQRNDKRSATYNTNTQHDVRTNNSSAGLEYTDPPQVTNNNEMNSRPKTH